jgi:hypothetical protein
METMTAESLFREGMEGCLEYLTEGRNGVIPAETINELQFALPRKLEAQAPSPLPRRR